MKKNLDAVLDECIDQVRSGESDIESCLARHPEYADELRDLLETTLALRDGEVPEPSNQAMDQGRERLLQAVIAKRGAADGRSGFLGGLFGSPTIKWAGGLAGLAALLLVGTGVALASQDSLPGEMLYPVKRGVEEASLVFAFSDTGKAERHVSMAENRAEELALLAPSARPGQIKELSSDLNRHLGEAQKLAASTTDPEQASEIGGLLEQSAHTHLSLLENSLGEVSEESRAAFNDAFQLSSQGYAEAVETVSLLEPAPVLASLGFLQLRASDPPAPPLDNVFVEVEKIEAHLAGGRGQGGWISIVEEPNAFDLLRVEQIHRFLGQQQIPAGTYTQIRLEVTKAVVVAEGDAHIAEVPSGKLKFQRPFTVREGETTIVTIDFDGQRSVQLTDSGEYILTPNVKLLVNQPQQQGDEPSPRRDHAHGKKLEIKGIIEAYSENSETGARSVVLGGQTINLSPETELEGEPAEGRFAEVEVVVEPDGSFTAVELEVKDKDKAEKQKRAELPKVEFKGVIEEIDGSTWVVGEYTVQLSGEATWQVGDQTVTVPTRAELEGDPQLGDYVEIEGLLDSEGIVLALEIEVEDDDREHENREKDQHQREHEDRKDEEREEIKGVIAGLFIGGDSAASLSEEDLETAAWTEDVLVTLTDGTELIVSPETDLDGILRAGAEVEVHIEIAPDGTRFAKEIDSEHEEEDESEKRNESKESSSHEVTQQETVRQSQDRQKESDEEEHDSSGHGSESGAEVEEHPEHEVDEEKVEDDHSGVREHSEESDAAAEPEEEEFDEEKSEDDHSGSREHSEESDSAADADQEQRFEGEFVSLIDGVLVLLVNGEEMSFRIDDETELDVMPQSGMLLRVEAVTSEGELIALEVKER